MNITNSLNQLMNRAGTIAYIAKKLEFNPPGKTSIQKIIYILQEIHKVPLGLKYEFYNHGPYSSELSSDLELTESLKGIIIESVFKHDYPGYEIIPSEKASNLIENASSFLEPFQNEIQSVIDYFGEKNARELELYATILYVLSKNKKEDLDDTTIIRKVSDLKPKYDIDEIEAAYWELNSIGLTKKARGK